MNKNDDRAQKIRQEYLRKLAELIQKQDDTIEEFVKKVQQRKIEELRKSLE